MKCKKCGKSIPDSISADTCFDCVWEVSVKPPPLQPLEPCTIEGCIVPPPSCAADEVASIKAAMDQHLQCCSCGKLLTECECSPTPSCAPWNCCYSVEDAVYIRRLPRRLVPLSELGTVARTATDAQMFAALVEGWTYERLKSEVIA